MIYVGTAVMVSTSNCSKAVTVAVDSDTSLVAGVSVAVTVIIISIITAIASSIIAYYWCCVNKRTSSVPPV